MSSCSPSNEENIHFMRFKSAQLWLFSVTAFPRTLHSLKHLICENKRLPNVLSSPNQIQNSLLRHMFRAIFICSCWERMRHRCWPELGQWKTKENVVLKCPRTVLTHSAFDKIMIVAGWAEFLSVIMKSISINEDIKLQNNIIKREYQSVRLVKYELSKWIKNLRSSWHLWWVEACLIQQGYSTKLPQLMQARSTGAEYPVIKVNINLVLQRSLELVYFAAFNHKCNIQNHM